MPRGVDRSKGNVPKNNLVAILHPDGAIELLAIGPIRTALIRDIHWSPGLRRQLPGAGEIICVDVGLGDSNNSHIILGS